MSKRISGWLCLGWLLAVLVFAAGPATGARAGTGAEVAVRGAQLLLNGSAWVPKGVTMVGLLCSDPAQCAAPYRAAAAHWGADELRALQDWGADTVRLQVSQAGLDPNSGCYTPGYLPRVVQAVALARRMGFVVIVSLQAKAAATHAGCARASLNPTDDRYRSDADDPALRQSSSTRAWRALAAALGQDGGVMFELFNEPTMTATGAVNWGEAWRQWTEGHQKLIDTVRGTGARNVLIVECLHEGRLCQCPPQRCVAGVDGGAVDPAGEITPGSSGIGLRDPLHALVFALHPYPFHAQPGAHSALTMAEFERDWGFLGRGYPLMVSEVDSDSKVACMPVQPDDPTSPQFMVRLLTYLEAHNIGLAGAWAFDWPGGVAGAVPSIVSDFVGSPTSYAGWRGCGSGAGGPGAMIRTWWKDGAVPVEP